MFGAKVQGALRPRKSPDWLKEDKAMQADRARLTKACWPLLKYAALEGAPLPTAVSDQCCEAC